MGSAALSRLNPKQGPGGRFAQALNSTYGCVPSNADHCCLGVDANSQLGQYGMLGLRPANDVCSHMTGCSYQVRAVLILPRALKLVLLALTNDVCSLGPGYQDWFDILLVLLYALKLAREFPTSTLQHSMRGHATC